MAKSKKMQICGMDITVNYVDDRSEISDIKECDGDFDVVTSAIRIYDGTERNKDQILLHEVIHAILEYSGIVDQLADPDLEEGICTALEHHLFKLMNWRKGSIRSDKG
jgi:hypothetical protein